jgi:hypothetical protein
MPVNRHTTNTGRQFELKAMSQELHEAKSAVVALGDGRGFLVNSPRHRQVCDCGSMVAVLSSWP